MEKAYADTRFFILNQSFETVLILEEYESLIWSDRYNEVGEFEIVCHPTESIMTYGIKDNYLWASNSDHLMIIESTKATSNDRGNRISIKGRSLECILERRVIFWKTVMKGNLEDAIRQLIQISFITPRSYNGRTTDYTRRVPNLIFSYSGNSAIRSLTLDYEFEKGADILSIIKTITQANDIGFRIYLNSSNQFEFKLTTGVDRSYGPRGSQQIVNPWVVFSPKFSNLMSDTFETDSGENYKNVVYVEGEYYNDQDPEWYITGSTTGLARREVYENASDINHELDDGTVLTSAEYTRQLRQRGNDIFNKSKITTKIESEIEPRVNAMYGEDYFIGDIVQIEDVLGYTGRARVTEFVISHETSGLRMYPTFTGIEEN